MTTGRGDLGASLVLIFPLLLAYELGVIVVGHVDGADVVTRALLPVARRAARCTCCSTRRSRSAFLVWIRRANRWSSLSLEVAAAGDPRGCDLRAHARRGDLVRAAPRARARRDAARCVVGVSAPASTKSSCFGSASSRGLVAVAARPRATRGSPSRSRSRSRRRCSRSRIISGRTASRSARTRSCFARVAGLAFAAIFWFRSLAHAVYAHVIYDWSWRLVG